MRGLFDFLLQNPILIFILLAWAAGMIGNVVKAARKGRERAEQQRRQPQVARPAARAPAEPGRPSEDDIAAEMRRILGMEPTPRGQKPAVRPAQPPPLPQAARRRLVEPERPPMPVAPTTQQRRLEIHVDPHVGEQIGKRSVGSAPRAEASAMGTLGGRVPAKRRARQVAERYPRTNLRQALVLSEILGLPLALRSPDPERYR